MTERPLPDRGSTLEDVAAWHPIDGTPTKKKVAVGCSVGATIETYDFIGFSTAGFPVGLLLANLAFLISVPLGGDWAWRVPFLLSAVLIVVGILIRLRIEESPEFEELKEEGELSKNPLVEVLRNDWRNVLRA